MTYDDLKPSAACRFKQQVMTLPPSEVHIVLWESRPSASISDPLPEPTSPAISSTHVQPVLARSIVLPVSNTVHAPVPPASFNGVTHHVPVRPPLSAAPVTLIQGPARPCSPQLIVGTGHSSSANESRLQRAREKFLRDKHGVLGSAVGAVVPHPACAPSVAANRNSPLLTTVRTRAERAAAKSEPRRRFPAPCPATAVKSIVPAVRERSPNLPMPSMPAPRVRNWVSSTYSSVLPLLKRNGVGANQASVFTGYVPKAKQMTVERDSVKNEVDAAAATLQQRQDEIRRPKVCFEPIAQKNTANGCSVPLGDLKNDTALSDPSASGCMQSTNVNVFQNGPPSEAEVKSTSLDSTCVPYTATPASPPVDSKCLPNENRLRLVNVNGQTDSTSEIFFDDWLGEETFASSTLKSMGINPEELLAELQLPAENTSVSAGSSSTLPSCDIFSSDDSSGLLLPETVTQFTFDDMLSFLYS